MPRYYFNVNDGVVSTDEDGLDLPDLGAVRHSAINMARSLIAEDALKGRICFSYRVEVEDEDRRPVLTLPFSEAVEIVH